jgi:hypothetical protein
MRLLRRKHRTHVDQENQHLAAAAVRKSEQLLADTRSRASEVHDLSAQLRRLRAENNFGARIATMLREAGENHERR